MTPGGSDSPLERAHADPVALAASFAAEIRAGGDAMELARCMPRDLAQRMAATGLFSMLVPAQYGGLQSHPRQFFEAIEATAKADGAVGWCLMIGSTTGLLAASLPEEHAGAIFSAQPDVVVSGVTAPNGIATRVDGGLEVSGRWSFGSACQVSDWISGGCFLHENGEPVVGPHGPQVLMPLFPAADVTIHDTWHTSGLCGTGSHDIEVRRAFVPEGRWVSLGGRPSSDEALYRFPTFGLLAVGVSAVSLGIAARAVEAFIALATEKTPTGGTRSLAARSSAQRTLARAIASVKSARAYTLQAIAEAWEQARTEARLSIETRANLRLAATNNAWAAADAVTNLYHAGGGSSIYRKSALQRCFRDVHVPTQHLMVAEPSLDVIGRVHLGLDPRSPL